MLAHDNLLALELLPVDVAEEQMAADVVGVARAAAEALVGDLDEQGLRAVGAIASSRRPTVMKARAAGRTCSGKRSGSCRMRSYISW